MKKEYKLPNYKKYCKSCGNFRFSKLGWNCCLECWEKVHGKYKGEDREIYVYKKPKKK